MGVGAGRILVAEPDPAQRLGGDLSWGGTCWPWAMTVSVTCGAFCGKRGTCLLTWFKKKINTCSD